jgi:hypothetical protein
MVTSRKRLKVIVNEGKALSETAKMDPEYSTLESLDNTGRY